MIIDGRKLALKKEAKLKQQLNLFRKTKKRRPLLISLVAQEDEAGLLYTRLKQKAASRLKIDFKKVIFSFKEKEKIYPLLEKIVGKGLSAGRQEKFDGLIIQKPSQSLIRKYFKNKKDFEIWWLTATSKIPEKKDVDCLNVANLGLLSAGLIQFYPATVKAIYHLLLKVYQNEEALKGKVVVIIGSSEILGKPLAMLLRNKGATVLLCGSSCRDLKSFTQKGEIIVSCVGRPKLITATMIKKGAIVIDAGFSKLDHQVVGDVDFEKVAKKASFITPVPGGVGPLTVISLMENLVKAYS